MGPYDPKQVEPKWQKLWDERQTYKADLGSSKPKYFAFSMFNYPSGAGIHIGHAFTYTVSDVLARFKRQQGHESYHPVGWDAFGLPAENYAIKSGISPQASMCKIIPGYHKQYKAMGWSNDWSKEISTHDPEYYKWTQWIFSAMYRHGLAYQASRMQWYCEIDNTVLADEQVTAEGKCWRHDAPNDPVVEKREIKQWFFKITDYAEELLAAIPGLDWTESVKAAQINWIGKSEGALIKFKVQSAKSEAEVEVEVFTTRPDTLYGATFLVLAPEYEGLDKLVTSQQTKAVAAYQEKVAQKSEVVRQASKQKTGVFTGCYAINPANDQKIPIWVAEYVLPGYGTGAIMAVPAHDERDHAFAIKFDLPIIPVIAAEQLPYEGEGKVVNSGEYTGLSSAKMRVRVVADLAKRKLAKPRTNYRLRDWSVSRQRYWGAPIPIVHCPKCGVVLVPDEDLPVVLPELKDFQPAGDGRSALARATDWLKVPCPKCGGQAERETDTLDTYIDSSWYFLRYLDPANPNQAFDSAVTNKWLPVDFYNGADHATAHMIYARFVTRFFNRLGLLNEPEPFKRFLFNGKVVDADGNNFSKSKGNAPDPLDVINGGYGADALRMYLMFAAPLDQWVRWDPSGVAGTYRFLTRLWNLTREFLRTKSDMGENETVLRLVHPVIAKVTDDIEQQRYNTAIAAAMELTNNLYREHAKDEFSGGQSWQFALETLVQIIAPFAPHIAEELWQKLGHQDSVHIDHWPKLAKRFLEQAMVTIVVQVNGKTRGTIEVASQADEPAITKAAKAATNIAQHLVGKQIIKTIYVPGRLVNFVING
ncbi:leucine--tRNA ligase [Candidatus Microgenomates bacterium]|nr:leucine--tRNA ligase [Candidatus Microgenomates bacterium]